MTSLGHTCPHMICVRSNKQKTTSTELEEAENLCPLCTCLASRSNVHVPGCARMHSHIQADRLVSSLAQPPAVHHSSIESWDTNWYP